MFHILFEKVNRFYEGFFKWYAKLLAKYYVYFIIMSVTLNLLLSLGIFKMTMITDSNLLFTPSDSEAVSNEMLIQKLFDENRTHTNDFYLHQQPEFGKWAEINFITCPTRSNDATSARNILNKNYLNKIKQINSLILNEILVTTANNETFGFEKICAKQKGKCLVEGQNLLSPNFYEKKLKEFMQKKQNSKDLS